MEGDSTNKNNFKSNKNNIRQQSSERKAKEEGCYKPKGRAKLQDEGKSYLGEGSFCNRRKEGATNEDTRAKEERKSKATGRKTEAARDGEEVKGRTRVEEEIKRRETKVGRKKKGKA